MIKLENTEVLGWEHAIRGMRNPMNSWEKSDSYVGFGDVFCCDCGCKDMEPCGQNCIDIGSNDHDLMMRLANGGPVHAKYRRMIAVYVDITAPFYWWKEFDTYKVGTVANSCSTMHKIHAKEFTLEDFSHEHLIIESEREGALNWGDVIPMEALHIVIRALNESRIKYLQTNDKRYWWQMIQLLPSSYNQKRTIMLNYEVLAGLYPMRKNHKLDEWREFCDWIETLPYSEIITGKNESEELFKIGEALHKGMEKGLVDAWKKANPRIFIGEQPVSQEEFKGVIKDWNELVDKVWKEAFPNDLEDDSSGTHDFLKKKLNIVSPSDEKENKE